MVGKVWFCLKAEFRLVSLEYTKYNGHLSQELSMDARQKYVEK